MMNTSLHAFHRSALATRFAAGTRVIQGHEPLSEDQMRRIDPSIFAVGDHASRSGVMGETAW